MRLIISLIISTNVKCQLMMYVFRFRWGRNHSQSMIRETKRKRNWALRAKYRDDISPRKRKRERERDIAERNPFEMTRGAYELRHAPMTEGTNAGRNVQEKERGEKKIKAFVMAVTSTNYRASRVTWPKAKL